MRCLLLSPVARQPSLSVVECAVYGLVFFLKPTFLPIERLPYSSTRATYPGCRTVVESVSSMTAGPKTFAPAKRLERS